MKKGLKPKKKLIYNYKVNRYIVWNQFINM